LTYLKLNWNNGELVIGIIKNKQFQGNWTKNYERGTISWKDESSFEKLSVMLGSTGCTVPKGWKGDLSGIAVTISDFVVDKTSNKISANGSDNRAKFTLKGYIAPVEGTIRLSKEYSTKPHLNATIVGRVYNNKIVGY